MRLILTLITIFTLSYGWNQTDKQINKAIKVFEKDYAKGIEKLNKYMGKTGMPRLRAWEVLVDMEYLSYLKNEKFWKNENIELASDEKEGTDSVNVISEENIFEVLMKYSKTNFLNTCRSATILSKSSSADYHLRMMNLEINPDSLVSEKAQAYYDEGEEFFEKEDYELAIMNYKKAIREEPNFYNANVQLSIAFLRFNDSSDSALVYLGNAKKIQPTYLEPIKIRVEIFVSQGLYFRAKKECLDGFCVYPGFDMKRFYDEVLYVENKYMDEYRVWRNFYPNDMDFGEKYEYTGVFETYKEAKYDLINSCNKDGIIKDNPETNEVYLEVYSWKVMLKFYETHPTPSYLKFAEEMLEEGYLDCYVLVSLFHYDLYPQFKHFMSFPENKDRTKEYIEKYLINTYK
jgi:tetratricopeptide (TPR) repeat protein